MTGEEMERAIQSSIERQAKVSREIEDLKKAGKMAAEKILALTNKVRERSCGEVKASCEQNPLDNMRETSSILTAEMRDRFNKLMLSNEVTRDLAPQVARLAVATSQRVTVLEDNLK